MKIHSLKFKNLNSLKGEWFIDFDSPEFRDNGLFAIMGPTGAGKTTILDAICLALYHRTPRQDGVSQSKNEIMTRHTGECHSEVEFSVNTNRYRAYWHQQRARKAADGKLQGSTVEVAEVGSEQPLETQLRKVRLLIDSLTGLNYDRFTRSVMLAQGGFTAFLKAEEKHKAGMLEEMTGTEIYSQIGKQVFERQKEETTKVALLEKGIEHTEILSPEQLAELKELEQLKSKELTALKTSSESLKQKLKWLEQIQKLEVELNSVQKLLIQAELKKSNFAAEQARLDRFMPALSLKPLYDEKLRLQLESNELNTAISKLKTQLTSDESTLKCVKTEQEKAQQSLQNFEKFKLEQESLINEQVVPLDTQIKQSQKDLALQATSLKSLNHQDQELSTQLKKISAQSIADKQAFTQVQKWLSTKTHYAKLPEQLPLIEDLLKRFADQQDLAKKSNLQVQGDKEVLLQQAKQIKALQKTVTESKNLSEKKLIEINKTDELFALLIKNDSLDQLNTQKMTFQNRLQVLDSLKTLAEHLSDHKSNQTHLSGELTKEMTSFKLLEQETQILTEKQVLTQDLVKSQRTLLEREQQILSLEQHRANLQVDAECPLCGSTDHPGISSYKEISLSNSQVQLKKAETQLNTCTSELNQKNTNLRLTVEKQSTIKLQIESIAKQIHKFESQWIELTNTRSLKIACGDKEALTSLKVQTKKDASELNNKLSELNSLSLKLTQFKAAHNQLGKNLNEANTQLLLLNQQEANSQKDLQKSVEQVQQYEKMITAISHELNQFLTPLDMDLNTANILSDLKMIRDEFSAKSKSISTLEKSLALNEQQSARINSDSEKLQETLSSALSKHKDLQTQLNQVQEQRQNVFGNKSVELERQNQQVQLKQLQEKLTQQNESLSKVKTAFELTKNRLHTAVQDLKSLSLKLTQAKQLFTLEFEKSSFENEAAFLSALVNDEEYKTLTKKSDQIKQVLSSTQGRVKLLEQKLKAEQNKTLTTQSLEELQQQDTELQKNLNESQRALTETQLKLQQNEQKEGQAQELIQKIHEQKNEVKIWDELSNLIGDAQGDKFSKFAQGITLDYLTSLANSHLARLFPRYQIDRGERLDLQVIDTYQADIVRPVSTLSGGESFLVSLALALGLSDLASDKVNIESLFLDEGFGTLDPETLDIALDALDSLKSSGRMVGVISHVEALKERITTRINVYAGNGISHLEDCYKVSHD